MEQSPSPSQKRCKPKLATSNRDLNNDIDFRPNVMFKVMTWNSRSINTSNIAYINTFTDIDILCIQEHWGSTALLSSSYFDNCAIVARDATLGGGSLIQINNSYLTKTKTLRFSDDCIATHIVLPYNKSLWVVSVYLNRGEVGR